MQAVALSGCSFVPHCTRRPPKWRSRRSAPCCALRTPSGRWRALAGVWSPLTPCRGAAALPSPRRTRLCDGDRAGAAQVCEEAFFSVRRRGRRSGGWRAEALARTARPSSLPWQMLVVRCACPSFSTATRWGRALSLHSWTRKSRTCRGSFPTIKAACRGGMKFLRTTFCAQPQARRAPVTEVRASGQSRRALSPRRDETS